jgi:diguanylate cyclase (GGDEF)-like protein
MDDDPPNARRMAGQGLPRDPTAPEAEAARLRRALDEALAARAELERLACHDGETGLLNHRGLGERLDTAVALARRVDAEITLLLFAVVVEPGEDGLGATQEAWRAVAAELTAAVREHDLVARTGATEFTVVLQASESDVAVAIAERLSAGLARLLVATGGRPKPSIGVGVATYPRDAEDVAGLWRGASVALARAREGGGGVFAYAAATG